MLEALLADPTRRDRQRSRSRRNDDQAKQEGSKEQTRTFISIVTSAPIGAAIGAVVGLIGFGFVGLLLSQYWPVFGGFIELNLAQPWSPARQSLIPIHLFVFGITGLVLGVGAGFLLGVGAGSLFGFAIKAPRSAPRR